LPRNLRKELTSAKKKKTGESDVRSEGVPALISIQFFTKKKKREALVRQKVRAG